MQRGELQQILIDQKEGFNRNRHLIERELDLSPYLSTRQVVVITGVRRCGKSSLLYLIKQKLELEEGDFCYLNFDDERIIHDPLILDEVYLLHLEMYKTEPVFFFDEIQHVPKWEMFINRMYEKGLKVYVTGSNAKLLSSEIASSLTGRNKTITLYPFSFSEFLRLKGKMDLPENLSSKNISQMQADLQQYMQYGGFPLVLQENDLEIINSYFQDILYRDIVARYRIVQVNELKQIALFLSSNVGKCLSYSTLQTISGVKSSSSIKSYVDYFEQSYLFSFLKKFDYSVKKQIMNPRKAYTIDPAICNRMGFRFSENKGRVLENIVYLELLRRKKEVFYYSGRKECDFVIREGLKIKEAIQVVYELSDLNAPRETEGLLEAIQTYQLEGGLLITVHNSIQHYALPDTITVVPAWKWLILR